MNSSFVCNACGVPFTSPQLLENHQRRFCVSSRVDREAANILMRAGYPPASSSGWGQPQGVPANLPYSPNYPAMGMGMGGPVSPGQLAMVPPLPMMSNNSAVAYRNAGTSALPAVDYELFQLIKTQQQQIALIQGMMNIQGGGIGNRVPSPRQFSGMPAEYALPQPPAEFNSRQPLGQIAPLASTNGESSLTEGRYGMSLFAVEGLDQAQVCAPEDISIVVREFVAQLDPTTVKISPRRGRQPPPQPTLLLEARGEHNIPAGSLKTNKKDRRCLTLKKAELSFSILQNRELHVFVCELYAPGGRLLAWTEVAVDSLGEKARPLRTGPVEPGLALKSPNLRVIPGGLIGLETYRTSWKQQQGHQRSHKSPSSESASSSSSEDSEPKKRHHDRKPRKPSLVDQKPLAVGASSPPPQQSSPVPFPTAGADPLSIHTPTANRNALGPFGSQPADRPQTTEADSTQVKVGKGPQRDAARFSIDSVLGVGLNVCFTRVLVYFASTMENGQEKFSLDAEDFFLRGPDIVAYQSLDSTLLEPSFTSETNLVVGKQTQAIAIVECVDAKKGRFSLGHAILPVNQGTFAGSYSTRLMWGDPRPSHLRTTEKVSNEDDLRHQREVERYDTTQLNQSLLSRELRDALKATEAPMDVTRFWPLAYIQWRADMNDRKKAYREPDGQLQATPCENILQKQRQKLQLKTPLTLEISTQDKAIKLFQQKSVPIDDNIAFVAPYDPSRGVFVKVECLRGMTSEKALFKVMVETVVEDGTVLSQFTEHHDFESDIGVPGFLDDPFVYPKVPYNPFCVAVFRIFKMLDPSVDQPGGIMPIAWSATKLFLDDNVARHGRFSIPLYAGSPPPKLLDDLKSDRIDQVLTKWTTNPPSGPKVEYLKPYSTVTFCQGDVMRALELINQREPFRFDPRVLLIPSRLRREFPLQEDEGYHEELLKAVIPDGKSATVFEEAMNKQIRKFFKKM